MAVPSSVYNSCLNCGCALAEHDRNGRCPRDISQPVSRVVAGPIVADVADADAAAFRALSTEQRVALLRIGADGAALLSGVREMRKLGVLPDWLAAVVDRFDARKG